MRLYQSFVCFLCLAFVSTNVIARPTSGTLNIKQAVDSYNKQRANPAATLLMMSQSSVDKKFATSITKGVKELPVATVKGEKIQLALNGTSHTLEKVASEKHSYLIDGNLYQDQPLAMLKVRYQNLQSAMQKKKVAVVSWLIPEANAQGWETAAAFIALLSLMGWMGYGAHAMHQPDQICKLAKNHLTTMTDEVTKKTFVNIQNYVDADLQNEATQTAIKHFRSFQSECSSVEPSEADHWQHCSEIAARIKCASDVLKEYYPEIEKAETEARKNGENLSEWNKGAGDRATLRSLMASVNKDLSRLLGPKDQDQNRDLSPAAPGAR